MHDPGQRIRDAANNTRNEHASARTVAVLTAYFAIDDTTGATTEMLAAGRARLAYPNDNLRQLAERLGCTRDAYAARLRRLENLAKRAHAGLASASA